MKKATAIPPSVTAVLMLAEIKCAMDAFDRGDTNVFEAIDSIAIAVEAYRAAANKTERRSRKSRKAA